MKSVTPRLTAAGRLSLVQLLSLIDTGVIGWWNEQESQKADPAKKIIMFPFKAERIHDLSKEVEGGETNRIITYRKIRKTYGSLAADPFSGTKEGRPRLREEKLVTDRDGKTVGLKIFGRWYDVAIRFDCFAPTWSEAAELEEDFDYLMDMFTGFIMRSGINKLLYRGTFSDSFHYQTDFYYESVYYYFRLERHYFTQQTLVREFDVNIQNTIRTIVANNSSDKEEDDG